MKYNKILGILACGAIALTSCQDDIFDGNGSPAKVGDDIVFGGAVTYEDSNNAKTRTVYGDKGESGTEIKWYSGDKVRIYCAEANAPTTTKGVDYIVNNTISSTQQPTNGRNDDSDYESSSLTRCTDEVSGLQWGAESTHNFYGIYPSPDMFAAGSNEASSYSFNFETRTFTGFMPNSQEPSSYRKNATKDAATGAVTYTIHPTMRYAYMMAHQTATPANGNVTLTFKPIVTAVEITITNTMNNDASAQSNDIKDISMVGVSSTDGTPIAGYFTSTYDNVNDCWLNTSVGNNALTSIAIPTMTTSTVTGTGAGTTITEGETTYPTISLRKGDKLKFTVFMILDDKNNGLNNLQLNMMIGSSVKNATLSYKGTSTEDFLIEAKKKNFIANVPLNYELSSANESNWISALPDNIQFNRLSIPGAGGAGSHNLQGNDGYKEQTLDINALWNRGVRCFEFGVDRITTSGSDSNKNLGESKILANGVSTGVNLSVAINEIQNLLKNNPREFAVVIITYQPSSTSADGNFGRQARIWSQEFYTYWSSVNTSFTGKVEDPIIKGDSIKLGTALLTSKTTVGDARGKLFCISRPTAIGGDPWWYSLNRNPNNVLSVAGWGVMPDQWYARGYINGNRPYSVTKDNTNSTMSKTTGGTNYLYPSYSDATPDTNYLLETFGSKDDKFVYNVFKNPGNNSAIENDPFRTDVKVRAQEWRRVCGTEGGFTHTLTKEDKSSLASGAAEVKQPFTYYWAYSYDEKKNDIIESFNKAINDDGTSGIIYINSLCGFYIDSNFELSYQNQRHRVRFYAGTEKDTNPKEDTQVNLTAEDKYEGWFGVTTTAKVESFNAHGGTQGDIAGFAKDINNYFYTYIKSVGANNISGATGIILMDRIAPESDKTTNPAGYYLPQIILNNNFRINTGAAPATVSEIKKTETAFDPNNETPLAKPRNSEGGMTITWE